jgi:hypothetical protein
MGGFMKYAVQMASGGMKHIPSFTKIGLEIQVILRLLSYLDNLRGSNLGMMYAVGMTSDGMTNSYQVSGIQVRVLPRPRHSSSS